MLDINKSINWDALLDAIEEEKCVLCIGPDVFTDETGASLDVQLLNFLKRDGQLDEDIIVYPDGLFYFRNEAKRADVRTELKQFYSQTFSNAEQIFRLLVHLPFNLIIFLTPDQQYFDVAERENQPVQRDFYFKKRPPQKKVKVSKNDPVVFHLLGSLEKEESLVLTYDDLFEFLESTFEQNSMATNLYTVIQDARHFICLGLSLEKWYMQLLLRVLNLHTNKRSKKYASNTGLPESTLTAYQDQFGITFVPAEQLAFVSELSQRCNQAGLIRPKHIQTLSVKEQVVTLIRENKLDEALTILCDYAEGDHELLKTITAQQRHFTATKREYSALKINYSEYSQECARIVDAVMDMTKHID